jgi:hypothetical protein
MQQNILKESLRKVVIRCNHNLVGIALPQQTLHIFKPEQRLLQPALKIVVVKTPEILSDNVNR